MSRLVRRGRRWLGTSEDSIAVVFLGVGCAMALVAVLGAFTVG